MHWRAFGERGPGSTSEVITGLRVAWKVARVVLVLAAVYVVVTAGQVWIAARRDEARPSQAIVVFGAAQYNGRPSPVLEARLDHAVLLYNRKMASTIVVTGGRQAGDRFTEATAAARYLARRDVPDSAILREVQGRNSWQSLAASAAFLKRRGITEVLLVSDPFHSARVAAMARELGLEPHTSPTRTSPIGGAEELGHLARETAYVAAGRIVGFRRLMRVDQVVTQVK